MTRPRTFAVVLATAGAALAVARHTGLGRGRKVPGGILVGDAAGYDFHTRLLLGSFFRRVAIDIAAAAPPDARVLEVGFGPGHLSIRLARDHGLEVTGLDLDPAMIARARANAGRSVLADGRRPTFVEGDVSALPFPDGSFDLIVSTLSMHHWADPLAGLDEIDRVLRPGGHALVWDFRRGAIPVPPSHARSGPAGARLAAPSCRRAAVAMALELPPRAADRVGAGDD